MKLKNIPDGKNSAKNKRLGCWGEKQAMELLNEQGFTEIRDLNDSHMNHPFADVFAKRNGRRYVISVKTRLMYERLGGLNSRYNLGTDWPRKAKEAEQKENAIAAWIAIQVDRTTFSAYFGWLSLVEESNGIPMQPEALAYYECFARNHPHGLDMTDYTPVYTVRVTGYTNPGMDQR